LWFIAVFGGWIVSLGMWKQPLSGHLRFSHFNHTVQSL